MVAKVIPVKDFDLVIFGVSGDLATRKILPGLYRRMHAGQMPKTARIIGIARSDYTEEKFCAYVKEALEKHVEKEMLNAADIECFLGQISYVNLDIFTKDGWKKLAGMLRSHVIKAFYFSVAPSLFGEIARNLVKFKLSDCDSRIVVEKPFGHNLSSAQALNKELAQYFKEDQIYRIDHYLGKETVQNLMAIRFGNALFEPLWNSKNIDHVQITAAESLGVEGRGSYYDKSGAMRDMVQNHLMQLLCLIAMEPPHKFEANAVRDEKLKIIKSLAPIQFEDVIRGQYVGKDDVPGYLSEVGNPKSRTECFVAMKVNIENWRWSGTPFYLRTGKRLSRRMTEIAVIFKDPPHSIFEDSGKKLRGNALIIRLQPDEGITLRMTIKDPGPGGMRLREVPLDMTFAEALENEDVDLPDAYERLIMDVIRGNQTLFMRGDEVEAAWEWVDPIISQWEDVYDKPLTYKLGGSGPEDALMLMHKTGRRWRDITE